MTATKTKPSTTRPKREPALAASNAGAARIDRFDSACKEFLRIHLKIDCGRSGGLPDDEMNSLNDQRQDALIRVSRHRPASLRELIAKVEVGAAALASCGYRGAGYTEERLALDALREVVSALSPRASDNPDGELIALCERHAIKRDNYNRSGGKLAYEKDPLWSAYVATCDAIAAARPKTLAGVVAKARAAKAEAVGADGEEDPHATIGMHWAWDLVNDLIRLAGEAR